MSLSLFSVDQVHDKLIQPNGPTLFYCFLVTSFISRFLDLDYVHPGNIEQDC